MSYNISNTVTDSAVATKANKTGDDFSNPETWLAGLGIRAITNALRFGGSLAFDGATAGRKVSHSLTGTIIGTKDFSVVSRFRFPLTTNPTVIEGIHYIGPDSGGSNSVSIAFSMGISTAGLLYAGVQSTSGFTYNNYSGFPAAWGGKMISVAVTRSGTTLSLYINGVLQTPTSVTTSGSVPLDSSITSTYALIGVANGTYGNQGNIYSFRIFNRALSANDVVDCLNSGITEADKWGSMTDIVSPTLLNGGFETLGGGGADVYATWTENSTGTATIANETSGVYAGSNALKLNGGASGIAQIYQNAGLVYGKTYRVSYYGKSAGGGSVQMRVGGLSPSAQTLTGTWTLYSFEVINTGSAPAFFYVQTASNTDVLIDNITIVQVGCMLDSDLSVGVGFQAPDRSSNNFHGDISTTGVAHEIEHYDGQHTIVKILAHSDISSTAATTLLTTLPKNCGIIEVEFDRTVAFDSGITCDIGITGTAAKFVSAQSLVGTTIALAASLSTASESNSANTSIWIKKSGSTTVGAVTVRITYRIRNK